MSSATLALLDLIAGRSETGFIELRQIWPEGAWQAFYDDRDRCAREIEHRSGRGDLYVGAALRRDRKGTADSVSDSWAVWADCDSLDAVEALAGFATPTLTIRSGTGSNLHAWWALDEPLHVASLKRANRRIAYRLGADMRATDVARVMRPPGSFNHKHKPPTPVEIAAYDPVFAVYGIRDLIHGLADPPEEKAPTKPTLVSRRIPSADVLRTVPADVYYEALTGKQAVLGRHCKCPFWDHQSPRPMILYEDGSWYCWPCEAGGTVYDFGARLWGLSTWGEQFLELRTRLADALGVTL